MYMLCSSIFSFGLKIFKSVSFLYSFVSDDGNGSETEESKYKIGLKIVTPQKIGITTHTLFITNLLVDNIAKHSNDQSMNFD